MQQKKFLLCDTVVGLSNVFSFGQGYISRYKNIQINNDYVGENATATAAIDLAGLGGGFCHYKDGDNIGSDLTTNGIFNSLIEGPQWTYGDNSPNDGALFSNPPDDYSIAFVNGQLKMKTYTGGSNAPYVYQNITVGPTLNFNVVINFSYSRDFVNGTVYATNVFPLGGSPVILPEGSQPYISIGGVSKKIADASAFSNYDNQDHPNQDRKITFTEQDFEGTGIQPGDTVELRIQMREDLTGANPLDLEFHFDSIEVFSAEDGYYTGHLYTNYEENAYIGLEGVQEPSKVIEDLTTVFDSFSEAGSNFNRQPSFIRASDLDLNATVFGLNPQS